MQEYKGKLLCYKLFHNAHCYHHCYVTSYLILLFNTLNHILWPAVAPHAIFWPAYLPPGALDAPILLSSVYSPPDKAMAS